MNKKLLMIGATPFFSDRGCHVRILNEMKYLEKNGFDVTLTTYHLGDDIAGLKVKRTWNIAWYKKTTPGASWHKLYIDVLLLFVSLKEYFLLRPKVIHAHLYEGLMIAGIIKIVSFFQVKIIFDCQGSLAAEMQNYTLKKKKWFGIFLPLFEMLEKILLFFADYTLCSSQNSYDILTAKYSFPKEKIDILEDGIDEALFEKGIDTNLRKELGIDEKSTVITYTGGLSNGKGIEEFLEYALKLLEKRNDIVLLVVGYGELLEPLKEKYREYIAQKRMIFTGRVSYFDLPNYINISDFCIDPKRGSSESSGKIYNYLAGGKKVIAFENAFTKNILGESGYLIKDFDEIEMILEKDIPQNRDISSMLWKNIIKKYLLIFARYDSK